MDEGMNLDERIVSAHPVEPEVRATVMARLRELEARHGVTVLYACESGSRGWGFASPDSDYDVRFLYVNRLAWYLTVLPGRDVIEQPIHADLDISGWDLRKALGLLLQSNPVLIEWLRSPIVYVEEAAAMERLRELAGRCFSPLRGYHHYVAMARKNFRGYLQGEEVRYKKYFYVLRPLLAARWIREQGGVPPMRFAELAQASVREPALIEEINRLLEVKMRAGEAATSARWPGLHRFIEEELVVAEANLPPEHVKQKSAELDAFLFDCVRCHDLPV
jgi:predicted nucleotidyltransferase